MHCKCTYFSLTNCFKMIFFFNMFYNETKNMHVHLYISWNILNFSSDCIWQRIVLYFLRVFIKIFPLILQHFSTTKFIEEVKYRKKKIIFSLQHVKALIIEFADIIAISQHTIYYMVMPECQVKFDRMAWVMLILRTSVVRALRELHKEKI